MPVFPGTDYSEAPRVRGTDDRTEDVEGEQAQLHGGADQGGPRRSGRTAGRQQQGSIPGQTREVRIPP